MPTNRPLRVFLCHSSNDKPAVRELYQKLRAEPWIQPWLDEEELYPGQDWNMEIERAIEETDVIIVCLSKGSTTKEGYVQKEIRVALDYADYKPEGTLFIIPVRLEECAPPKRLGRWQYADYFEGQRERALQRLLVSLKRRADSLELSASYALGNIIKDSENFWPEMQGIVSDLNLPEQLKNQNTTIYQEQSRIVGIDLGTKNSSIAGNYGGETLIIPSSENEFLTPSIIAIDKENNMLVGSSALKRPSQNIIFSAMRLIGRKYDDQDVQHIIKRFPHQQFIKAPNGDVRAICNGQEFSLEEIVAAIFSKLRKDAENYFGTMISQAVVAVPALFNEVQRKAIKVAGTIAGIEVLRFINDTSAASMAYNIETKVNEIIGIYNLGAGACSFSIINISDGIFETRSTSGDVFLGGDDFDQRIVDYLADAFLKNVGIDLRLDFNSLYRLRLSAEKAKVDLSSVTQTEINLPYITADIKGPKHLIMNITREKLEEITSDLIDRTLIPIRDAITDSGLKVNHISKVIMIGGMTKMPAFQRIIANFFDKDPYGGENWNAFVVTGSAIQAGIMNGVIKDVLLLDVITHSFGIETLGGATTNIIERNTTIPARRSFVFSTATDNQNAVDIHIVQGERPMAPDNISLGHLLLDGIPSAPKGIPQIEVTYEVDANGNLIVTARDKTTNREQKTVITPSSGLTQSEVERLRQKNLHLNN